MIIFLLKLILIFLFKIGFNIFWWVFDQTIKPSLKLIEVLVMLILSGFLCFLIYNGDMLIYYNITYNYINNTIHGDRGVTPE